MASYVLCPMFGHPFGRLPPARAPTATHVSSPRSLYALPFLTRPDVYGFQLNATATDPDGRVVFAGQRYASTMGGTTRQLMVGRLW